MIEFLIIQTLNGLVYSMLLFLLALGLSLTFGMLRVVNLAHGAFFLMGAYFGLSAWLLHQSFWFAVVIAAAGAALIGGLLEKLWLQRFYARSELDQVILTFGFALVFADIMKMVWGKDIHSMPVPPRLRWRRSRSPASSFPSYRLLLIGVGVALFVVTWLAIERTRIGALIRASVADREMVGGLGFNVRLLFTAVFAFGTGLAGLAGVLGAPITGIYPGLDFEVLITTLIVVVVGGLGSITGAFWASLLIGVAETYGKALLPEIASFIIFGVMAAVLLFRSWGQGRRGGRMTPSEAALQPPDHNEYHRGLLIGMAVMVAVIAACAAVRPAEFHAGAGHRDSDILDPGAQPRHPAGLYRSGLVRSRRLLRRGRLRSASRPAG